MTKKELKQESAEYVKQNYCEMCVMADDCESGCIDCFTVQAYLAAAEPREKRIAELEAQIEKMKCCENCAKRGHICVAEEMQGNLCGKNKDKWELRR